MHNKLAELLEILMLKTISSHKSLRHQGQAVLCESLGLSKFFSLYSFLFLAAILTLAKPSYAEDGETKALKDLEFLGLKIANANLNTVRIHLWDIGGFKQAKSTVKQRNIDKFFPWSTIRDSYHITFHYNNAGDVVSVKRLYRPYSLINNNKRTPIDTKDIAISLVEEIGQPKFIKRKGSAGGGSYSVYTWQDDNMKVTIDREGGEILGNVFVEYTVKNNKRFEVIKEVQEGI